MMTSLAIAFSLISAILIYAIGYAHGRISRITKECIDMIIDSAIETLQAPPEEPPAARFRTLNSPPTNVKPMNRTL